MQIPINVIVYPDNQVKKDRERFSLQIDDNATGADVKAQIKKDFGYSSRWLQLVHLGRIISDHEQVSTFDVTGPRNTIVIVPKPVRLAAKRDWWRVQERDLRQESIEAALGDSRWPPILVTGETGPSANFSRRHEVWLRRIAQLASIDIINEVPEPSFVEAETEDGVQTTVQAMLEERKFAMNEVIPSWEDSGWELKDGIEKLWVRSPARNVHMYLQALTVCRAHCFRMGIATQGP